MLKDKDTIGEYWPVPALLRTLAALGAAENTVLAKLLGAAVQMVPTAAETVVAAVVATVARPKVAAPVPEVDKMFANAVPALLITVAFVGAAVRAVKADAVDPVVDTAVKDVTVVMLAKAPRIFKVQVLLP